MENFREEISDDIGLFSRCRSNEGKQTNLFSILDDDTREIFVSKCIPRTFQPGQSIFMQGYEHVSTYIIENGQVRTYYVAPTGREITLGYWSTGDLIGAPDVLGGGIHVWSATASQKSKLLVISGLALREFAVSHPEVSQWIIDVLGFKLRWMSVLFQILGTDCVEDRLIKLLLLLAENSGESSETGTVIKRRINQKELGTMVGTSRQWTNKTLNHLKDRGLLSFENRQIVLRDPAALRRLIQARQG